MLQLYDVAAKRKGAKSQDSFGDWERKKKTQLLFADWGC